MKKHSTEKNVFSAAMNLQMSHMDKESYDRCNNMIAHSSRTVSMLVAAGVVCVALWFFLDLRDEQPETTLYPLTPIILFLIAFARYRHLHKQSLEIIKNLNKK